MKTSLLTTATMVHSSISSTTKAGAKLFSGRSLHHFFQTGLALGILVAVAVNSANASAADEGNKVAALDTSTRPPFKRTIRPRWTASWLTISY